MAAKKYICKVCGYVHEGSSAPDVCPLCKAGSSEFEVQNDGKKKKGLNTNSDVYAIIYSAVMVVIVAFLLAGVSSLLKEKQDTNVALDKKKQILASLNLRELENAAETYDSLIVADPIVDINGKVVREAGAFDFPNDSVKKEIGLYPLYVAKIDGATKYVLPMTGNGLWGGIWGYIALNDDCNSIYGVYFSHASETPGLGAEIASDKFQSSFTEDKDANPVVKKVFDAEGKVALAVEKGKGVAGPDHHIDAISGATITCRGLNDMLQQKLEPYYNYLKNQTVTSVPATELVPATTVANDSIQANDATIVEPAASEGAKK